MGTLAVIAVALHLAVPVQLVENSANISNFGALLFPFMLMYLNSRLSSAARPRPWHYMIVVLNTLFFGFFLDNGVYELVRGVPLVSFQELDPHRAARPRSALMAHWSTTRPRDLAVREP